MDIWDSSYVPTKREIENLMALFLFIKVLNYSVCFICKWLYLQVVCFLLIIDFGLLKDDDAN
jgi:hypothetical protein